MLFARRRPALTRGISLRFRAATKLVRFRRAHRAPHLGPPDRRIAGMNIDAPVDPRPAPSRIVKEQRMRAPIETNPRPAPSPRREETADRNAEAEADRPADHES